MRNVKILLEKTFEFVSETDIGHFLNKGDIFLPDGTGWEYEVTKKVCSEYKENYGYSINVMVKPLSKGARNYAEVKQANRNIKELG